MHSAASDSHSLLHIRLDLFPLASLRSRNFRVRRSIFLARLVIVVAVLAILLLLLLVPLAASWHHEVLLQAVVHRVSSPEHTTHTVRGV